MSPSDILSVIKCSFSRCFTTLKKNIFAILLLLGRKDADFGFLNDFGYHYGLLNMDSDLQDRKGADPDYQMVGSFHFQTVPRMNKTFLWRRSPWVLSDCLKSEWVSRMSMSPEASNPLLKSDYFPEYWNILTSFYRQDTLEIINYLSFILVDDVYLHSVYLKCNNIKW